MKEKSQISQNLPVELKLLSLPSYLLTQKSVLFLKYKFFLNRNLKFELFLPLLLKMLFFFHLNFDLICENVYEKLEIASSRNE